MPVCLRDKQRRKPARQEAMRTGHQIRAVKTVTKHDRSPKPEALLTVREVAELDGCSEKTVRRAIGAGLLDVVRVGPAGRLVRIEPSAHRAYRRRQRH